LLPGTAQPTRFPRRDGKRPDKSGFSEADLNRAGKLRLQRPVVAELVKELVAEKRLTRDGVHLRLPEHRSVGLDGAQLALWTQIEKQLRANGSKPPKVRVLSESVRVDERRVRQLLKRQARDGAVYEVSPELYFPADVLHGLARETERLCRAQNDGSLSVGTFRETTGLGRNLSIELLEFFDRRGLTVRVGDGRRLQKSAAVVFQQ
jgi:selenocysteine-specific elongation factor